MIFLIQDVTFKLLNLQHKFKLPFLFQVYSFK